MKTKLKVAPGAILYLAYFTYIFYRVLNTSMYAVEHGRVVHLLDQATELLALCCVVIFLLYKKRYKVQEFLFLGAIMGILALVYFRTGYQNVVTITLLFMCGYRTNFRDIVKVSLFALLFSLAFVLLSWRAGLISDLVYYHQMVDGTVRAHTYGFSYYTYPPYILLAASMEWVYLRREKTSWAELAVTAGIAYVAYQVFTSRASFLMTLLFIVLY
ncbi:MAG: hypothetical protein LUF30_07575, partial [Lachnospiraceae bacterium]|nr:hypothetical protein [Lachnospiraceae bacterium]